MDNPPSAGSQTNTEQSPEPEVLKTRDNDASQAAEAAPATPPANAKKRKHRVYRPSHKATFLSLGVVVIILAINAGVVGFLLKNKNNTTNSAASGSVTISPSVLDKLGVSNTTIGSSGVQLVIGPDAQFKGKVLVAGNTTLSGDLNIDGKETGTDGNFTTLESGNTSVSQLNVNGNTSTSNLSMRGTLVVNGQTTLQGATTIGQLLTVTNSVNIQGNLAVGGTFSAGTFSANGLTSTSTLTIGGHIITNGASPSFAANGGGALGSNGTASISGNDSAGVINVDVGVGATAGTIGKVTFKNAFASLPRIEVSLVSPGDLGSTSAFVYVISPSTTGFSVGIGGGLPPGGFAVDYIVMQ